MKPYEWRRRPAVCLLPLLIGAAALSQSAVDPKVAMTYAEVLFNKFLFTHFDRGQTDE
jgi:hypothetical protein